MNRFRPPPPEVVRAVREYAERRLSAEEFDAYVKAPVSEDERQEVLSLIDWFTRRYPTAGDRLTYNRRAWAGVAGRLPFGAG